MKLIEKRFKNVDYFGIQLEVPRIYNYIASDESGVTYLYENLPYIDGCVWEKSSGENDDEFALGVMTVDLEGLDWRETLKTI